ncbi:MAG: geranylgeranylglyceryl/heptaprenylglyceryl phosphate synthase [bacterium]
MSQTPKSDPHPAVGPVEQQMYERAEERGGCLCILLDPDRHELDELSRAAEASQAGDADFLFVGSSLLLKDTFDEAVEAVKKGSDLPVLIFPGDHSQVSGKADALLFLSLISGRNPEYLIGHHVLAAPRIHKLGLETIPTGYMLIESGRLTSVQYMSMTAPMPRDKPDIVTAHGLAARFLGMRLIYLEGGSGGENRVPAEMVRSLVDRVGLPVVVGGGIRKPEQARERVEAGASFVVVGNSLEHAWTSEAVRPLADAVHIR